MTALILLFVVFLFLSGILAAIDAALLSVTHPEISEMVGQGKWGARRLQEVKKALTRAVVVIVILTNTVNVLGPVLVSRKAVDVFGVEALGITIIALTLGTIVFSEIIPKALGAHYAQYVSRLSAPLIRAVGLALYPLVRGLEWLAEILKRGRRRIGTEEQIRALVTIGKRAGLIEGDEMRMIHRAFLLNDRTARDLMTPLENVIAIDAAASIGESAALVREHAFSRYPVFGNSPDEIEGWVLVRDLLQAMADGRQDEKVRPLVRPAFEVEADRRSDWLLVMFRDRHVHLAIVRENDKTLGVVTLEDVLEELVGQIEDETDVEESPPGRGTS